MTIYQVITEIEAESISEAWDISSEGHPKSFSPSQDWRLFKKFTIQEISSMITMKVEKENI